MKLVIKESNWSSRSTNKPEEIEKVYELKINEKYVIKTTSIMTEKDGKYVNEEREVFSFDIIEINEDSIKIRTYQPFSDNDNGTINVRSDKKEFDITLNNSKKLVTPTMDFGYIFTLSLLK